MPNWFAVSGADSGRMLRYARRLLLEGGLLLAFVLSSSVIMRP